jgi:hypothetical protein
VPVAKQFRHPAFGHRSSPLHSIYHESILIGKRAGGKMALLVLAFHQWQ